MSTFSIECQGAAGGVTGSCYWVKTEQGQFYIDAGIFQGNDEDPNANYRRSACDPKELDAIFLTHGHLDHCGLIPPLVRNGFRGPIIATKATAEIAGIVLKDQSNVIRSNGLKPLYDQRDYEQAMSQFEIVSYGQKVEVAGQVFEQFNANHILGSSILRMRKIGSSYPTVVFSGDKGSGHNDSIEDADIVFLESTYGNRNHVPADPHDVLQYEINQIEKQKEGTLLIPSFAIDRSAVILSILRNLKMIGAINKETEVYFNSPMGLRGLDTYKRNINGSKENWIDGQFFDFFKFPNLIPTFDHKASMGIPKEGPPKVIIAGSGMMQGGRILELAKYYLQNKKNRLLLTGYQGLGTLGRELADKATETDKLILNNTDPFNTPVGRIWDPKEIFEVEIEGQIVPVRAHLAITGSLSSHADQKGLLGWLHRLHTTNPSGLRQVILTHGNTDARDELAELISWGYGVDVLKPNRGDKMVFDRNILKID